MNSPNQTEEERCRLEEAKRKWLQETKDWATNAADCRSKKDTAVFYSHDKVESSKGGEKRRFWYSKELQKTDSDKATTLQKTQGWKDFLEKLNAAKEAGLKIGDKEQKEIVTLLSTRFAQQAEGKVKAFSESALHDSIWIKNELPALLKNGEVTEINGEKREELKAKFDAAMEKHSNHSPEKQQLEAAMELNQSLCPKGEGLQNLKGQLLRHEQLKDIGYDKSRKLNQSSEKSSSQFKSQGY